MSNVVSSCLFFIDDYMYIVVFQCNFKDINYRIVWGTHFWPIALKGLFFSKHDIYSYTIIIIYNYNVSVSMHNNLCYHMILVVMTYMHMSKQSCFVHMLVHHKWNNRLYCIPKNDYFGVVELHTIIEHWIIIIIFPTHIIIMIVCNWIF